MKMKKLFCFIITAALVLSFSTVALAKPHTTGKSNTRYTQQVNSKQEKQKQEKEKKEKLKQEKKKQEKQKQEKNKQVKEKKNEFKINGSPAIKYERYIIPISPITKGMGAKLTFDKTTAVLTVEKDTTKLVIDLKNKTVTINDVEDTNTGIFTAKNDKKSIVLVKYIASALGVRADMDKDKVTVEEQVIDLPTNIKLAAAGTVVKENTVNTTTQYLSATATITAGQATGGKAELYVGSKLVATDTAIAAADTSVTFNTLEIAPTNEKLRELIPTGGVITIKLYNAKGQSVVSAVANPSLVVDYEVPTLTGVNSTVYSVSGGAITINVTGASAVGDIVDVTKISLTDTASGATYQLTSTPQTGSVGVVKSDSLLEINLGLTDRLGLTNFGKTGLILTVSTGSFLTDNAGNTSTDVSATLIVPVTVIQ
jgi:hypothetical protein